MSTSPDRAAAYSPSRPQGLIRSHVPTLIGFALMIVVATFSSKAMWIVMLGLAIVRGLQLWPGRRGDLVRDMRRMGMLWPLAALALASTIWALDPEHTAVRGVRFFAELALGGLMIGLLLSTPRQEVARILTVSAYALLLSAVVAAADVLLQGDLLRWAHNEMNAADAFNRGALIAGAIVVPLVVGLAMVRRWLPALAAIVGTAIIIQYAGMDVSAPAAILGVVVLGVLYVCRRVPGVWAVPFAGLAASLIVVPVVLPIPLDSPASCWAMETKLSAGHRLGIWNFVDARIDDKPWLGWGMEASRAIPGGKDMIPMPDCGEAVNPEILGPVLGDQLPLHPHDLALNLRVELGIPGLLLGLAVIAWLAWQTRRQSPLVRAVAGSALAGAATYALLNLGMWQGPWLVTLFYLVGLVGLIATLDRDPEKRTS